MSVEDGRAAAATRRSSITKPFNSFSRKQLIIASAIAAAVVIAVSVTLGVVVGANRGSGKSTSIIATSTCGPATTYSGSKYPRE
jgi:hypothetical protein